MSQRASDIGWPHTKGYRGGGGPSSGGGSLAGQLFRAPHTSPPTPTCVSCSMYALMPCVGARGRGTSCRRFEDERPMLA